MPKRGSRGNSGETKVVFSIHVSGSLRLRCERNDGNAHWAKIGRLYSCKTWWTKEIAIEPSPTAEATRFTLPARTSPTAKTPGRLVSSKCGERDRGHCLATRSSRERSGPVLMKP